MVQTLLTTRLPTSSCLRLQSRHFVLRRARLGRLSVRKLNGTPVFGLALLLAAASALPTVARAQQSRAPGYQPSQANLEARRWFQDAKFGMFIHWGVYSTLSDGEWVMQIRHIPGAEYQKLPAFFNPTKFDAAAWV